MFDEIQNGGATSEPDAQMASVFRLVTLALIVITPLVTPGMAAAYSSIALPQMNLNLDEASWFASLIAITCPVGCLFTGLIIDKYGRRTSIIASIIPNIIGWFLLADTLASLTQLYLGRLLTGFALGASSLPSLVYAAECITVNNIQIRSSVSTWTSLALGIGALLVYALGALLPCNEVAFIAGLISIAPLILILLFIPESPIWLYRKGRIGDAELAQQMLGIKQPILQNRKITTVNIDPDSGSEFTLKNLIYYLRKIKRRDVYKPLIITISFLFFSQFSGVYCLNSYMVDVISVHPLEMNPYFLAVIGGTLQFCTALSTAFVLPYTGVKTLSLTSYTAAAVGFVMLGFSILFENSSEANVFNYVHVISIWWIVISANLGLLILPYSILGEMFPMGAKGYASLSLVASSSFNFIVLKIFPYLFERYRYEVFFGFALICMCGVIFVKVCLPETVGKTMDEISRGFKKSKVKENGILKA